MVSKDTQGPTVGPWVGVGHKLVGPWVGVAHRQVVTWVVSSHVLVMAGQAPDTMPP